MNYDRLISGPYNEIRHADILDPIKVIIYNNLIPSPVLFAIAQCHRVIGISNS